jgi:hypothetical protein
MAPTLAPLPSVAVDVDSVRLDLLNLIDVTRRLAQTARRYRSTRILRFARANGFAFDAAVNILDTLGAEYVATASAVVDAGQIQFELLHDELADYVERANWDRLALT